MKHMTTLILLALGVNAFGQEGWIDVTPPGAHPGLLAVHAIDSNSVWVVGEEGTVLYTTDGGMTWIPASSGTTESLFTVEFINPDTGWIAGDDDRSAPTVLRTTDRGVSWKSQTLEAAGALPMYDVDFIRGSAGEPTRGFITGGLGYTWRTENHGEFWDEVRGFCENTFYSCYFANKDTGWFVGTPSVAEPYTIMCTTDGGGSWEQQTNPTGRNLRGVCFGTDQRGIAVGLSGAILYTSDGGANWEARPGGLFNRFESVFLLPSGKAWAVGQNSTILYSTDWGYTWSAQESGLSASVELWEVYFINNSEGWIVGGGIGQPGVILHTTNGGVLTSVDEENSDVPQYFRLAQNYPNPFNPTTTINFDLPQSSTVRLSVFDLLGREVSVLVNERREAGHHSVNFNGFDLSSGVYFYRLQAGEFVQTRNFVLLR